MSFPKRAIAISSPSAAKTTAVAKAAWKPLVSAPSGSLRVGMRHGDGGEDRDADGAPDLERGVVRGVPASPASEVTSASPLGSAATPSGMLALAITVCARAGAASIAAATVAAAAARAGHLSCAAVGGARTPRNYGPWWVWVSLFPLGLGAWAVLVPAFERRKILWALPVLVWIACLVAGSTWPDDPDGRNPTAGGFFIAAWVGGAATALIVRQAYFADLRRRPSGWDLSKRAAQRRLKQRREAIALVAENPALALEMGIGRPDVRGAHDAGLVDINHASAKAIAGLPGFDAGLGTRVVTIREDLNGFSSLADFGAVLDLDGNVVERLRERVVFLPR